MPVTHCARCANALHVSTYFVDWCYCMCAQVYSDTYIHTHINMDGTARGEARIVNKRERDKQIETERAKRGNTYINSSSSGAQGNTPIHC